MDAVYEGTLSENRKARFEYEVLEEFVAGVKLIGYEVKAIRTHRVQLAGSFVSVSEKGIFLKKVLLPKYDPARAESAVRDVELLVTKKERERIGRAVDEQGVTAVPLQLFCKGKFIKLRIALCKGRKLYDKRQVARARDLDREARRGEG